MIRFTSTSAAILLALHIAPAGAETLAAHAAFYALDFNEARDGSDVVGLTGRMSVELSGLCDGRTFDQRFVSTIENSDGSVMLSDFQLTAWEDAVGAEYLFNLRHRINGALIEEYAGAAHTADAGAEADFTKPPLRDVALPAGVIFPLSHSRALLAAAEAGDTSHRALVFDGTDETKTFETIAVIGPREETAPPQVEGGEQLADMASWRVNLSYYDPLAGDAPPEYEVRFRLYANGVAGDIVMDYGDFDVTAALLRIEPRAPGC